MTGTSPLGERIRDLRKHQRITLRELGARVGVSHSAVSKWESGDSQVPSDLISEIAAALRVTPGSLFEDQPPAASAEALLQDLIKALQTSPSRIEIRVISEAPAEFSPTSVDRLHKVFNEIWEASNDDERRELEEAARTLPPRRTGKRS